MPIRSFPPQGVPSVHLEPVIVFSFSTILNGRRFQDVNLLFLRIDRVLLKKSKFPVVCRSFRLKGHNRRKRRESSSPGAIESLHSGRRGCRFTVAFDSAQEVTERQQKLDAAINRDR